MNEKNYLNETELTELIASIEKEPLSKAPGYLKEQILHKASERKPSSLQNTFLIFSVKVAVGAAAAIALLFSLPNMNHYDGFLKNTAILYENEHSLLEELNKKTDWFCNFITDTANSIFMKEDF